MRAKLIKLFMVKGVIFTRSRRRRGLKQVVFASRLSKLKGVSHIRRQVALEVARQNGAELKFHDLDINDAVIAQNGTIAQVTCVQIAEGIGEEQRVGRKLTVRSINWRFDITGGVQANTATPNHEVVRVILYLDKQANGATAAITDILEVDDYQSFNHLANKSRFRTLMDRTYNLDLVAATGADATSEWSLQAIQDTLFKKVNIPIEYDNTAADGSIATIRSNNIGVLLLSKFGLASFGSKMRIRYSDV